MKKVGIVTITQGQNYGNRLQNYAVQTLLKKNGCWCETIKNYSGMNFKSRIKEFLKPYYYLFIVRNYYVYKRMKNFKRFNKNNINFSPFGISNHKINPNIYSRYDFWVAGSDQIWNMNYSSNGIVNFLGFVKNNRKIALAPSFGMSCIPMDYDRRISDWIADFKYLSVREENGLEYIRKLTGRTDVTLLIDPTMILERQDWIKVEKKPSKFNSCNYILVYFLGDCLPDRFKGIMNFAKDNKLDVINIGDKNSEFYSCGPEEFLYLERNAKFICTDSFHSVVFAIINNVPFYIYERNDSMHDMSSRINTLLSMFKLEFRKFQGNYDSAFACSFNQANKIIEEQKSKFILYLKKGLEF